MCCACLSAAASDGSKSDCPIKKKSPASLTRVLARVASAPHSAPIRFFLDYKRPGCSIRRSTFSVRTIIPVTIARQVALHVTSSTRTIAIQPTRLSTTRQEISDVHKPPTHRYPRTNQDIRSSTSSRARFRRRSAWSATCTREQTWSPRIKA